MKHKLSHNNTGAHNVQYGERRYIPRGDPELTLGSVVMTGLLLILGIGSVQALNKYETRFEHRNNSSDLNSNQSVSVTNYLRSNDYE